MKYIMMSLAIMMQIIPFAVKANGTVYNEFSHILKESHQRGLFNGNISIIYQGKAVFEKQIGFTDSTKSSELSL